MATHELPRSLGDGLVLRCATPGDADALADFCARVHSDEGWDRPDEPLATMVRDLAARPHPTFSAQDFTLVEDTSAKKLVSMLCLIPQTWTYDGIAFGVGRPELVGTHPDYRRRGLVRAQFDVAHRWSAKRGHMVQAITGIPWYYRQFGYEMAVNLGGSHKGYRVDVPKLKEGEQEVYRVRAAGLEDLAFLRETHDRACERSLVSCQRGEALWRYELDGRTPGGADRLKVCIIETPAGSRVGYLLHNECLRRNGLYVSDVELAPGISWLSVMPPVLRYLAAAAQEMAETDAKNTFEALTFGLGAEHPAYVAAGRWLPVASPPYAWYIRVPDLKGFVAHIAPALERRLASSVAVGHTGELTLGFYRNGLRLVFDAGRITAVEGWQQVAQGRHGQVPGLELSATLVRVPLARRVASGLSRLRCQRRGRTPCGRAFPEKGVERVARLAIQRTWP